MRASVHLSFTHLAGRIQVVHSLAFTQRSFVGKSSRHNTTSTGRSSAIRLLSWRPTVHETVESEVAPSWLARFLGGTLDPKGGMLIWYNIILIIGVRRLMLRRDVNLLGWKLDASEVLQQVRVVRRVQMDIRER